MQKLAFLTLLLFSLTSSLLAQPGTPCNAQFTFTISNANNVQFTPVAAGDSINTLHTWIFGDGAISNLRFPQHIYLNAGTYHAYHVVTKLSTTGTVVCRDSALALITIAGNICNLQAQFLAHQDSTIAGLGWQFVNTSIGAITNDSIRWTFGDGSSSSSFNGYHIYNQPGTYNVCLRIIKRNNNGILTNCISDVCHTITVGNNTCNLHAGFTFTRDSLAPNTGYQFHNASPGFIPGDSIRWTFGDGTSSGLVNPFHAYAQPGTYNVCLRIIHRTATGGLSNCVSESCHTITVTPACNLAAHFTFRRDSLNPRKIYFINNSVAPTATTTASWSFGDGATATGWNTVHEYAQPGTYTVCLEIHSSSTCAASSCQVITIAPPPVNCQQMSAFSFTRVASDPLVINFQPNTLNNAAQYTWTFGDGTGSHAAVTSHRYPQSGNYNACLTAYASAACASTTCRTITILECSNLQIGYHYQSDSPAVNRIHFTTISNGSIVGQSWSILKLGSNITSPLILNQVNPTYIFPDTGYYRVCLRATMANGCIKEYCEVLHITNVVALPGCTLQVYPNPASGQINAAVQLNAPQMLHAYIYNILNVQVKEKHQQGNAGPNVVNISIADLPSGIYRLVIIHGNDTCSALFHKL